MFNDIVVSMVVTERDNESVIIKETEISDLGEERVIFKHPEYEIRRAKRELHPQNLLEGLENR
jgi:hypothetical protein